jgi:anti-anti-sigma factor
MTVTSPKTHPWLEVKQTGTVVVVKLPAGDIFHDELIDCLGEDLLRVVEESGCRRLVLNFESVDRIASNMLGVLLVTHKRIVGLGGRLALCSMKPELHTVFATLRLDQVFTIYDGEQEATSL